MFAPLLPFSCGSSARDCRRVLRSELVAQAEAESARRRDRRDPSVVEYHVHVERRGRVEDVEAVEHEVDGSWPHPD